MQQYVNKMREVSAKSKPILSTKALAALGSIFGTPAQKAAISQPASTERRVTVNPPYQYDGGIVDRLMAEMRAQRSK